MKSKHEEPQIDSLSQWMGTITSSLTNLKDWFDDLSKKLDSLEKEFWECKTNRISHVDEQFGNVFKEVNEKLDRMKEKINSFNTEIALLKFKSSLWGAAGAGVIIIIYMLVHQFKLIS
jgi:thiamine kinase-like enzyme